MYLFDVAEKILSGVASRSAYAWGSSSSGQCGISVASAFIPTPVSQSPAAASITDDAAIAASDDVSVYPGAAACKFKGDETTTTGFGFVL